MLFFLKRERTLLDVMVKIMALYMLIVLQVCTYDQETYIKNAQPFLYATHASIKKKILEPRPVWLSG